MSNIESILIRVCKIGIKDKNDVWNVAVATMWLYSDATEVDSFGRC